MRKKLWWLIIPLLLVIVYLAGPQPATPEFSFFLPKVPDNAAALDQYVQQQEQQHKLKPDNEARIVWANDSLKNKTEYAIVYLHGFSASQAEGEPVHRHIAKQFGCNLYLSRLAEHGIDTTESLVNLTVENYWESAQKALAIGNRLGNKVILMGTSTGGTLALKMAATYRDIHALVLLSPNIAINDPTAWLLNNPWGLQIARLVVGSNYIVSKKEDDQRPVVQQYWNNNYRIEAAVTLEELLETTMTKATFSKVTQPTLLLYYYKDEVRQDSTVKVSAMKEMFEQLATPADKKQSTAIPNAGAHVIGSYIKSKDLESVEQEIEKFMTGVLNIQKTY